MPRRRRRRKKGDQGALLLAGVGCLAAAAALSRAEDLVAAHATTIIVAAVVILALVATVRVLAVAARVRQSAQQARRDRDIAATDTMTGPQFEQYVARLMRRDGLRGVRVCGGSGDLGADITARTGDGRRVVVQCKRYSGSVGDPHVQKFNGTAWQIHKADVALLVTTGRPTSRARQLATRCRIVLVDRDELAAWATDGHLPAVLSTSVRHTRRPAWP
ncbi:restriction endonuclease [Micromonospora sp. CPCC 205371]|nr:restriction endonuclease [Micromonospora sp. CPCC 205371]